MTSIFHTAQFDERRVFRVLRRQLPLIAACALGVALAGLLVGIVRGDSYTATAQIILAEPVSGALLGDSVPANEAARAAANELAVLRSDRVRAAAAAELGHRTDVTVTGVEGSDVAEVSATARSASQAASDANGYAQVYISQRTEESEATIAAATASLQVQITELGEQLEPLEGQIENLPAGPSQREAVLAQVTPVRNALLNQRNDLLSRLADLEIRTEVANAAPQAAAPAVEPGSPSTRYPVLYPTLGLIFGVVVGIWSAFALERRRGRVVDETDVRIGGVETKTVVAIPPERGTGTETGLAGPGSPAAAGYRRLAAALAPGEIGRPGRALVVVPVDSDADAPGPAADLALALTGFGRRVALVDANLRTPALHGLFDVPEEPGLGGVLQGRSRLPESLCSVRGLLVLPAGKLPVDAPLDPGQLASILSELRNLADVVIVATPPPGADATAEAVAPIVEDTVLVAASGRSFLRSLRDAAALAPLIGPAAVVLVPHRPGRRAAAAAAGRNASLVEAKQ